MAHCAAVLDRQRLGKQRVECLQILNAIADPSKGWQNHPATRMWREHPNGLAAYAVTIIDTWIGYGYKDTCRDKVTALFAPDPDDMPGWWGRDDVMLSHRSNLMRKMPAHYGQFYGSVPDDLPYVWPV